LRIEGAQEICVQASENEFVAPGTDLISWIGRGESKKMV
jgi:hypothetical protein